MCSTHVCLWFEFLMLKKAMSKLKIYFCTFSPTKFCDVCVPGQRRHLGHFSIQKVVISDFLAFLSSQTIFGHLVSWPSFFSGPRFEICSARTELWFGNIFPDCLNFSWIFFLKLILRSYFGPRDIQIAFFFLTILHIDKHITRVDFSEVDFIVKLDGNVLEAVNLWYRDRVRGVMKT